MLQDEVTQTGRRIVCCSDGSSARTLYHATPERFELLILEAESRREPGTKLAKEVLAKDPRVKVLLLTSTNGEDSAALARAEPRCSRLHKPFGAIELREAVTSLLEVPVQPIART